MKALILGNSCSINDYSVDASNYSEIIGVNRIYLHDFYKNVVTKYIALDYTVWKQNIAEIFSMKNCTSFYIHERYRNRIQETYRKWVTPVKLISDTFFGNSIKGYGHGFTSVYPAIQIAINDLEIKDITLLGIEFSIENQKQSHFFGNRKFRKSMDLSKKIVSRKIKELEKQNIKFNILSKNKWNKDL